MFDGMAAGQRALAGGIASVGQALHDFSEKKQAAVNFATVADANRQMDAAFSDYQDKLRNNGDEKTYLPDWQKDVSTLEKNLAVEKMPPALRGQMQSRLKDWKQETTQNVRSIATAREINRAGSKVEMASADLFNSGKHEEAIALIREGERTNLYSPDKAAELINQQSNGAAYGKYSRQISDITELPPAARVKELAKLEASLSERDADGRPVTDVIKDGDGARVGGLGDPARTDLIQNTRSKIKSAEREMGEEMRRLLNVRLQTSPDEFSRQAAESFRSGKINVEAKGEGTGFTFKLVGDGKSAAMEAAEQEAAGVSVRLAKGEEAAKQAAIKEQRKSDAFFKKQENDIRDKTNSLLDGIMAGKTSAEDIDFAVNSKEIPVATAKDLRATLKAHSELAVARGGLTSKFNQEDTLKALEAYATMTPKQKDSVDLDARKRMLAAIDSQKDMSEEAKATAMKTYLDAMNVDLKDWSKDGNGRNIHLNGRKLTKTEVEVRARIGAAYEKAANLGKGWAGASMIQVEDELTAFFKADTYQNNEASAVKAEKLTATIVERVNNLAASRVTAELFGR